MYQDKEIRVLVVDDEIQFLDGLKRTFRKDRFKLFTAQNGQQGLDILKNNTVDVIVSDLRMPVMDGAVFLKYCYEKYRDIPRIVLSGHAELDMVLSVVNSADIFNFVTKPSNFEDLRLTITNAANQRFLALKLDLLQQQRTLELEQAVTERTTELREANRLLKQAAAEENAVTQLLELAIKEHNLNSYLEKSIKLLIELVPWLSLLPQGAIFLTEKSDNSEVLNLLASYNLDPAVISSCKTVDFGDCLCGKAALEQKIQFARRNDDEHDKLLNEMQEHGNYSVPILHNDKVLGVIALYLPYKHNKSLQEIRFLQRVANVFSLGIREHAIIEDLKNARSEANTDPLTGLFNRRYMRQFFRHEWNRHIREKLPMSVIMIDIDFFKQYNDTYGHDAGDQCLITLSSILKENARRSSDLAVRLGGEEFVIILPDTNIEDAKQRAIAISDQLREQAIPHSTSKVSDHVTLSMGLCSTIPKHEDNIESILELADQALYKAKNIGRDSFVVTSFEGESKF